MHNTKVKLACDKAEIRDRTIAEMLAGRGQGVHTRPNVRKMTSCNVQIVVRGVMRVLGS